MSVDSQVFDKVTDYLVAVLAADYQQIPNPYFLEENPGFILAKGFGVGTGPGRNTERYVGCLVTWERVYNIILTKQVAFTQNDVTARELFDKALRDDVTLVLKKFELNPGMDGLVIRSRVVGDSGIQAVDVAGVKYFATEIILEVEYQEDPNT